MSGRGDGDPGGSGLDRAPTQPTTPTHPPCFAPAAYSRLAVDESNVHVQNHSRPVQVLQDPKAVLERTFARINLNPGAVLHQSAAGYSSLHVPKRSRSPPKKGAPPFQYRASPRPDGYHILSSGTVPPSSSPQEAHPSGHNFQQFKSSKPLPPLPAQGCSVEPFTRSRVAPPRPPRSPTLYDFSQYTFSSVPSTSAFSLKPFYQAPIVKPSEKLPPPSSTQALSGKPILFDPARGRSISPGLVPPHKSGRYNPLRNPFIQKTRSPSPKPIEKLSFWKRAKRKVSRRRSPSPHSISPVTPAGRSSSGTTDTTPFPRPRAPTPNRGLGISTLQADLSSQKFSGSLDCETGQSLNRVTDIKTLFSVTDAGATILHVDPADGWEIEALAERGILTTRTFDYLEFQFKDFGVCRVPFNRYQPNLQDSVRISSPKPENPRESQDSSDTLVTKDERPRSYSLSTEYLTVHTQNHRRSEDSAATLITQAENPAIYRDPQDRYYSLTGRDLNPPQVAVPGGPEEANEWSEIPLSTVGKSESSPVPSCFFEENIEVVGQDSSRLPGEINLKLSYSESLAVVETQPARVLRTPSETERVKEYCRGIQEPPQLAPGTPRGKVFKGAFLALTGALPTDSLCLEWGADRYSSVREAADSLHHSKLEGQVDVLRSQRATGSVEDKSPSRGRGRGRLRQSRAFPSEGFPLEEYSSYSAKRKYAAERRKYLAGYRPRDREGSGEGLVDKFNSAQRRFDRPPSFGIDITQTEEAGARIVTKRTLSAAKRGLERRRRKAAALDEVAASVNRSAIDKAVECNNPLDHCLSPNARGVDCQSDCAEKVDEDLAVNSESSPSVSKESVESLANPFQQFSSKFVEQDIVVCTRSKTGTVRELPVTPEDKKKIKAVLELETVYTASVYSGEYKESVPPSVPDLLPSPLVLKLKTPSPAISEKTSRKTPSRNVDPFRTARAFLDSCLSVSEEHPLPTMDTLQVSSALRSSTKTKAEEDARAMQKSVIESCTKSGRDPPKYVLMELIGKGSFGRVYKGKDINTTKIVAVKIIDIDESDTLNPRLADTYSEIMKEVNALKILSESKAKNINHVIEALPVGTAMWMITEYCGGGSIATLMKPTPDGLREKFIVPILREVAEAVKWVHQAGIIHRDLKCANILITEEGGVQLCDFGVAGITETALDKRSTFIGTPHWMAPELFRGSQYGKEIDIWAFGSMTYEMATGLPPNAMSGVNGMELGAYLKTHIPRLEGDNYSEGLKSIVAFCLEENPSDRPTIEAVQRHSYIYNTSAKYPSSGLSDLVKAFKLWESHGGTRKSLFAAGGAQGPSELSSTALSDDNWNFSTTPAFDQAVAQAANAQDIINVYGASVALGTDFVDETSRPVRQQQARPSRRRAPPEALAPLKAPLEKLFDPNTMSNYKDNAISHFNLQPNPASDLPLRDDSAQISIRDTLIDLDAHDIPSGLSSFSEMDTMKPARRAVQDESEEDYESAGGLDFSRPALSDPVDNPNRRTQDWKFPSMAPPASANSEVTRFPALQRPNVAPASGARPALIHHPTEPIGFPSQSSHSLAPPAPASDRMSLIDLDMSIPEPSRPSTADSAASQDTASANPFMWERHFSMYHAQGHRSAREPSLYLDDSASGPQLRAGNNLQDLVEVSDFSASDAEGYPDEQYNGYRTRFEDQGHEQYYGPSAAGHMQGDYEISQNAINNRAPWDGMSSSTGPHSAALFHPLPPPPSAAVLSGTATYAEMHAESHRMFSTLRDSLETFKNAYESMPTRPAKNNQGTSGDDTRGTSSMQDTGFSIS